MQPPHSGELQTMLDERVRSRRPACSADRNLFCTSDRLVKSGPLAICDHGQGFAAFVRRSARVWRTDHAARSIIASYAQATSTVW